MEKKYKVIDRDEPGYMICFPSSLGKDTKFIDKEYYYYSKGVMDVVVTEFGIGNDDLVGFIGDKETMIYLFCDLIKGYLNYTDSHHLDR